MTKTTMSLVDMARQSGMTVSEAAEKLIEAGIEVNKYADPISDEEIGIDAALAAEVAAQVPSLLYVEFDDENDVNDVLRALGLDNEGWMTKTTMSLVDMARQSGMTVSEAAEKLIEAGIEVNKYADPISDEEIGIDAALAAEVAAQDPSLLYVEFDDENDVNDVLRALGLDNEGWMEEAAGRG